MTNLPRISVIIPVYNGEKTIESCVNAVLHQDYKGDFEVIIVDDGSTDATSYILGTFDRVIYIRQQNSGPAVARNAGFKRSTGEVVCFTDADCQPANNWLSQASQYFQDNKVEVLAGSYGIVNNDRMLARCIHQEILYRHEKLMGEWVDVFGSYNVAFRRETFDSLNGFDESFRYASAEDNDLSYRLRTAGVRIRFAKDLIVGHAHPVKVSRYLREQFRHGFWRARLYRRHPEQMKGDGYTFVKDMIEVPFAVLLTASLVLWFFNLGWITIFALLFLVAWEAYFSFIFGIKDLIEIGYFGAVMAARTFFRTAGFIDGFLNIGS